MKKIASLLLLLALVIGTFAACGYDDTKISVGVINGPTGMGMAKLMQDKSGSAEYEFHAYTGPDLVGPALASGELQMACLPTNVAAKLSLSKTDFISVIAVNTLGSLYIVSDEANKISSISELSGKTIYTSVTGSTTNPILEYLLEKNGVTDCKIETPYNDHPSLAAALTNEKDSTVRLAVLPEPIISTKLMGQDNIKVRLDLTEEWKKVSEQPLAMGCIVVRNDFLKEHPGAVERFLNDYKKSVNYIVDEKNTDAAAIIAAQKIIPAEKPAQSALNNLRKSIVYMDGKDMKDTLVKFYEAIGQAQPKDEFYYD